jgi:hypothetical protein
MLAALLATASLAAPMPNGPLDPPDQFVTCGIMHMKLCLLETVPFDQRDPLNLVFSKNPNTGQTYFFADTEGYEWSQNLILQTRADGDLYSWIKTCRAKLKCRPDDMAWKYNPNGGYYKREPLIECLTNRLVGLDRETKEDVVNTLKNARGAKYAQGWNLVEHILQTCQKDQTRKVALMCHKHLMNHYSRQ